MKVIHMRSAVAPQPTAALRLCRCILPQVLAGRVRPEQGGAQEQAGLVLRRVQTVSPGCRASQHIDIILAASVEFVLLSILLIDIMANSKEEGRIISVADCRDEN
jgi:hypothetical protein